MKRIFTTLIGTLALITAASSFAQEAAEVDAPPTITTVAVNSDQEADQDPIVGMADLMSGLFGDAFKAEPLSADQEARLPQATLISSRTFPEGTFAKMMNDTMKPMIEGIMGGTLSGVTDYPIEQISGLAGDQMLNPFDSADDEKLAEVTAIIDPAYQERNRATMEVALRMVSEMMSQIEPAYRDGLAKAYAKRFTIDELAEVNRFFETPVGSRYAAESLAVTYDPQVMAAMNEMMPAMFELLPTMMAEMAALEEKYPAAMKFFELDAAQQKRLSDLLGVSVETLAENAAAMEAEDGTSWEDDEEEKFDDSEDVAEEAAE